MPHATLASGKNNLKKAEELSFFKCKLCLFEQDISRSIFMSIRYAYIKTTTDGPHGYPLISTNVEVSPFIVSL